MEANAGKSFQMQIIFNIFPRISLHCNLVPVQYWEYKYDLLKLGVIWSCDKLTSLQYCVGGNLHALTVHHHPWDWIFEKYGVGIIFLTVSFFILFECNCWYCFPILASPTTAVVQFPSTGDFFEVFVSAIDTPDHFWVQLITEDSSQLDKLTNELTSLYSSLESTTVLNAFKVGCVMWFFIDTDNIPSFYQ